MAKTFEPLLVEFEAMKKSVTDWGALALMLRFLAYERLWNSGISLHEGGTLVTAAVEREMRAAARELAELIAGGAKAETLPLRTASDNWGELERRVQALEHWRKSVAIEDVP